MTTAVEALEHCSVVVHPNLNILLRILATLPVTTASPERIFSKVEKIASAVRASMSEERLEALVMLQSHADRTPNADSIINKFAETAARRCNFII